MKRLLTAILLIPFFINPALAYRSEAETASLDALVAALDGIKIELKRDLLLPSVLNDDANYGEGFGRRLDRIILTSNSSNDYADGQCRLRLKKEVVRKMANKENLILGYSSGMIFDTLSISHGEWYSDENDAIINFELAADNYFRGISCYIYDETIPTITAKNILKSLKVLGIFKASLPK
jgi:hypothetical protein